MLNNQSAYLRTAAPNIFEANYTIKQTKMLSFKQSLYSRKKEQQGTQELRKACSLAFSRASVYSYVMLHLGGLQENVCSYLCSTQGCSSICREKGVPSSATKNNNPSFLLCSNQIMSPSLCLHVYEIETSQNKMEHTMCRMARLLT